MHKTIFALTATAFLALVIVVASGQAPAEPRGVLAVLRAGQPVSIKDTAGRYEVSVFKDGPEMLTHQVVEVASDYLVVKDVADVTEARIPIFAIKAVTTIKVGIPTK